MVHVRIAVVPGEAGIQKPIEKTGPACTGTTNISVYAK